MKTNPGRIGKKLAAWLGLNRLWNSLFACRETGCILDLLKAIRRKNPKQSRMILGIEQLEERAGPTDLFNVLNNILRPDLVPSGFGSGDASRWGSTAESSLISELDRFSDSNRQAMQGSAGADAGGADVQSEHDRLRGLGAQGGREHRKIDFRPVFEKCFVEHGAHAIGASRDEQSKLLITL